MAGNKIGGAPATGGNAAPDAGAATPNAAPRKPNPVDGYKWSSPSSTVVMDTQFNANDYDIPDNMPSAENASAPDAVAEPTVAEPATAAPDAVATTTTAPDAVVPDAADTTTTDPDAVASDTATTTTKTPDTVDNTTTTTTIPDFDPEPITSIDLSDDGTADTATSDPDTLDDGHDTPSGDGAVNKTEAELTEEIKALMEDRGEKTIDATRVKIDVGQVENIATGLASDAMEDYKIIADRKAEAKLAAAAAKRNMSVEEYKGTGEYKAKKIGGALLKVAKVGAIAFAGFMGAGVIGAGILAGGALLKNTVNRAYRKTATIKNYYEVAKQAIMETGNLNAGKAAIEKMQESDVREKYHHGRKAGAERDRIVDEVSEQFKNGGGTEQYVFERAKEAFKDNDLKDMFTENGEKFESDSKDTQSSVLKGYIIDYAEAYARANGDEAAQREALERFNQNLNQALDDSAVLSGNGTENVEVKGDYSDVLEKVRSITDKVNEGILNNSQYDDVTKARALRRALEDKVKINVADMKAGLNTNELLTLSEKASIRGNVLVGIAVAAFGEATKSASRFGVTALAGRGLPPTMAISGLIGGLMSGIKKSRELKRENIKQALGRGENAAPDANANAAAADTNAEAGENRPSRARGFFNKLRNAKNRLDERMIEGSTDFRDTEIWTNVDKLSEGLANVNEQLSNARELGLTDAQVSTLQAQAIDMMARYTAANKLQNQYGNKFKLLQFNGREGVDKAKFEIAKNMSALKKTLKGLGVENPNDLVLGLSESKIEESFGAEVANVVQSRRNAVLWAGFKGAAIAAGASLATRGVTAVLRNTGVMGALVEKGRAAEDWRANVFRKMGFKEDSAMMQWVHKTSVLGGGAAMTKENETEEQAGAEQEEHHNREKNITGEAKEIKGENELNAENVRKANAPMIIEDDPEGGVSVGFDMDGDGQLDPNEFLYGKGDEPGINFNDKEQFNAFKNRLESEFRLTAEKGEYDIDKLANIKVKDYVGQQGNVVEANINKISSQSKTLVTIHRPTTTTTIDGMNYFEVKIDGNIPEGASAFVDLDGDGPMQAMQFEIRNGKALVPAGVVDTDSYISNGKANFVGRFAVGKVDSDGSFISYGADRGKVIDSETIIKATEKAKGSIITVIDQDTGNSWAQVAVTENGTKETAENLSHLFNGDYGRMPRGFVTAESDGRGVLRLASGAEIEDLDYKGGYRPEYDPSLNDIHKAGGNSSLLGIPLDADVNGDGVLNPEEEARFVKQWLITTGTNPNALGQNAALFGVLEPDNLKSALFNGSEDEMLRTLEMWGIKGGAIDNLDELNLFIEQLKLAENADLYDKLVNSTITEMQEQLQGAYLEVVDNTSRRATYLLKGQLAVCDTNTPRQVVFPYHMKDDTRIYDIGNKGFYAEKLGAEGGQVGASPNCGDQAMGVRKKTTSEKTREKTTSEKTKEKQTDEKTKEKQTDEKTKEKQTDEKTKEKQTDEKTKEKQTDEKTKEKQTDEKTKEKQTDEKTKEKQTDEKTKEKQTDEKTKEKQTDEKTTEKTTEKQSDEKTTDEGLTPKTGDMNAGPNVTKLDETPVPKPDTTYVEATPDNHVTAEVKPSAPVHDADASVYANDTVVDKVTGDALKDEAGNIYVTKPQDVVTDVPTPQGNTAAEEAAKKALEEEIAQNIVDDTQTTYTPDTTKWVPEPENVALPDLPSANTESVVDAVTDNAAGASGGTPVWNMDTNLTDEEIEELLKRRRAS